MKVVRANAAGFCSGVRRALETAEKALVESEHQLTLAGKQPKVYTLGPIVHNQSVVEHLAKKGIGVVEAVEELPPDADCQLIIRSHGVGPGILRKAEQHGLQIIDATCPLVRRVQQFAQSLATEGYVVVIVGDKYHPEVTGILDWTMGQGIEILAEDKGPGIANLDRALTDGFSSARGLGMGLPGTKRLMDEFYIESNLGMGTQVVARKWLD